MRLLRDPRGSWHVTDFIRDGIPMSITFQPLEDTSFRLARGVTITVDSVVAFPTWQFDLVVQVRSGTPIRLTPADATIVDADGHTVATAGAVTPSLARVLAGARVEGIVTFEARPDVGDLTLRLAFRSPTATDSLEVPIADLIQPVPVPTSTGSSPSPSAGG
jgi:hypothetical protein